MNQNTSRCCKDYLRVCGDNQVLLRHRSWRSSWSSFAGFSEPSEGSFFRLMAVSTSSWFIMRRLNYFSFSQALALLSAVLLQVYLCWGWDKGDLFNFYYCLCAQYQWEVVNGSSSAAGHFLLISERCSTLSTDWCWYDKLIFSRCDHISLAAWKVFLEYADDVA